MSRYYVSVCNNENERDDCGGYCKGRKCENCKFHGWDEVPKDIFNGWNGTKKEVA